jgi:hypothetical protein
MSWLNASDYVFMEIGARDRVEELRAAGDVVSTRIDAPEAAPPPAERSDVDRAWRHEGRGRHDTAALRRCGYATVRSRAGACSAS